MIERAVWIGIFAASVSGSDLGFVSHPSGDFLINAGVTHTRSTYDSSVSVLGVQGKIQKRFDSENVCSLSGSGSYAVVDESMHKNRWTSEVNYDYRPGEDYFINYKVGYDQGFFGREYQKWYHGPTFGMRMDTPGDSQLEMRGSVLVDKDCSNVASSDAYVLSKIGAVYSWYGRENIKFIQEEIYRVRLNEPNDYTYYSKSGIESRFSSRFSMGINYKIGRISTPFSPVTEFDRSLLGSVNLKF